MEWNNDTVLHFIELYKNKPMLWDPKNSKYYNKFSKNDAWEELAAEMKTTADECRKKITSLLASFRREKMKIRNSHGTGTGRDDVYESTWFAFKSFAFIMDRDTPRPTLNTIVEEQIEPERDNSFEQTDDVTNNEGCAKRDNVESSHTRPIKKKKKTDEDQNMLHKAFSILNSSIEAENEDECSLYGKYIGQKLRHFSVRTKAAVQHAIGDILFKADQGLYEYNYMSSARFNPICDNNSVNPLTSTNSSSSPDVYNTMTSPPTYTPGPSPLSYNNNPLPDHVIVQPSFEPIPSSIARTNIDDIINFKIN